ncbi:MAG: hypothetical protein IPO32_05405 [Crocinitomicaceae bacterium]|nr:hypothetical protein [Crocinitomicaceae bacterium]
MGDDTIVFSGVTLDVTGTVHGSADYVVNFNQWMEYPRKSFGPSPIICSTFTKSHVGNYYYIYDSGSGALEYYDGSDGSSSSPELANGIIATGQGFWTYDFGWITFKQSDKTASTATFVRESN